MRLPNTKIFVLSTLLVAAFFISLLFTFFKHPSTIHNSLYWVQHAQEVLYKSEKILSLVANYDIDITTLQLTNSTVLKQESALLKQEIKKKLAELKQLTTDNLVQQQNIALLTNIISIIFLNDNTIIDVEKSNDISTANRPIINSKVLYLKDVKRIIATIQAEEEKLLVTRKAKYDKALLQMTILFYTLGLAIDRKSVV